MSDYPSSPPSQGTRARFALAAALSLLFWALLQVVSPGEIIPWTPSMTAAASAMDSAEARVARYCEEVGIRVDPGTDPNRTCLLGPEISPLFTSLGQLDAKRTTLAPDMAGLLVHLLSRAGVGAGDSVAVGGSGSFPGLLMAVLTAIRALDARPVTVVSLGASSFGATRPDFNILDLYRLLRAQGFVGEEVAAVSLGGAGDVGREFDPVFRDDLLTALEADSVELIREEGLRENVARRMGFYGTPAAFVNVGGAEANLGTSPKILQVPPGLVQTPEDLPSVDQRGVVFEMMARGIPVIHLLHVRGLALRYGLPWDPIPLPPPGTTLLSDRQRERSAWFWFLTLSYAGSLVLVGVVRRRRIREDSGEGPRPDFEASVDGAAEEVRP